MRLHRTAELLCTDELYLNNTKDYDYIKLIYLNIQYTYIQSSLIKSSIGVGRNLINYL